MTKLKIVWICHFTNAEVQAKLPLWRNTKEFGSWIPNTIVGFEENDDIELHIIAPHDYLKRKINFCLRGINYHFIPVGIPLINRHWPRVFRFDVFSNFFLLRNRVKRIIERINPDLINLIGAENAYYSSSILDFKNNYPVLITIQGFISEHIGFVKLCRDIKKRISVEKEILRTFKYFSGELDSSKYISKFNSNHGFFKLYFPVNERLVSLTKDTEKKYDCIYCGRLTMSKGAEDFINVIAEIKGNMPDVKACIIGSGDIKPFQELAENLNCKNNIEFVGFVKSQKELFEFVKSSKIVLIPSIKDRLPSTMRESMWLHIPIVAYATGSIPLVNEYNENILMVKTGDYKEMVTKAIYLLQNEQARDELAKRAHNYARNEYSVELNAKRFISAYKTILNN